MIHLGFSGTRHGLSPLQHRAMCSVINEHFDTGFIAHHGDCIGADAEFHAACRDYEARSIEGHPPDSDSLRAFCGCDVWWEPKPYLVRNADIVKVADLIIACPYEMTEQKCGGTWSTWRLARDAGKRTVMVMRDGTIKRDP